MASTKTAVIETIEPATGRQESLWVMLSITLILLLGTTGLHFNSSSRATPASADNLVLTPQQRQLVMELSIALPEIQFEQELHNYLPSVAELAELGIAPFYHDQSQTHQQNPEHEQQQLWRWQRIQKTCYLASPKHIASPRHIASTGNIASSNNASRQTPEQPGYFLLHPGREAIYILAETPHSEASHKVTSGTAPNLSETASCDASHGWIQITHSHG
ncbi:MAG: hypothetical protein OIF57_13870 [Marinobacterium sp.]|nr:hypothetical protein [Marinobacterium sp.]